MKLPASVSLLAICVACTTATTSENTADSTELAVNTMSSDFSEGPLHIKDTTYTEVLPLSSFTSPQLNDKVAYVFSPVGLDVYESANGENVVGNVEWRSKVLLALPLANNAPADTMTVDGLKGRLVEITYKGGSGYVFSGYLVGMPVPDPGATIIEYFTKNLHLVKPATRSAHECMSCDDMYSEATYEFENGIVVRDKSTYESYDNGVNFKSNITLQEVYLFAKYFYTRLNEEVPEFPQPGREKEQKGDGEEQDGDADEQAGDEEEESYFSISFGVNEGRITGIVVSGGEGCSEEESVSEGDGEIVMSSNGGC